MQNNHTISCQHPKTKDFDVDCPECMRIWNNFLEDHNLYVITDRRNQ